ncbi:hypothetical protein SLS62_000967 [Diatrype stigma]|uniref:Uncharacterized protein n=1 Tax=Diatrype stigma TaxID=117547 RepID=A0AAN9YTZ4_9PEZI
MAADQEAWFLKSTFPVLFPTHPALALPSDEFDAFLKKELAERHREEEVEAQAPKNVTETYVDDSFTMVSAGQSTTAELRRVMKEVGMDEEPSVGVSPRDTEDAKKNDDEETPAHPFMKGLMKHNEPFDPASVDMSNKMFTENMDIAHRSTHSSLVDLFSSLEATISGPHLLELLNAAWKEEPLLTLKVIFNARSIHLGKAERASFYRCAGWLAQNHPLTLISNLRWLSRPVIEKKVEKKEEGEEDAVLVEAEKDEDDVSRFDVRNGVSHGYWKDLLNILALSANGRLTVLADPAEILNVEKEVNKEKARLASKKKEQMTKAKRHAVRDERHQKATELFDSDPVHRALHITVARLFAEQLRSDLALLRGDDPKAKRRISLCAKWAPSHDRFHDKHTFIVSTVAEILYPMVGEMDRELYLRHARESYRKDISSLRQHLDVVERNLSAKTLDKIKYDRVPSKAMQNYAPIFAKKDTERFNEYLDKVSDGTAKISGATLLPSTLISEMIGYKSRPLQKLVANAQWKPLVQRVKDNGKLESSIAVCDVSGSMYSPVFPDATRPIDSAIGLSLLVAEVTAPPFGGSFITFSENPKVQTFDVGRPLSEKIDVLVDSQWGMSTNFAAVFEDLILPMAVENQLKPEDMVKRIFVFSDMQFNEADSTRPGDRWTTSYERIKKKYADAGYEVPQMVFWNLAGGRAGFHQRGSGYHHPGFGDDDDLGAGGDPVPPKPVTVEDQNTALVSGYSQGMLKVFLQDGSFEDPDEEAEETAADAASSEEKSAEGGLPQAKKRKIDPLLIVKKAVGHKAYDMLKVVD